MSRLSAPLLVFLICAACSGGDEPEATSTATSDPSLTPEPSLTPAPTSTPTSTLTPTPAPTPIAGNRFKIPRLEINAGVSVKPVPDDGLLPDPDDPDNVVMYDFAAFPGLGGMPGSGNVVVAGDMNSFDQTCQDGTLRPPCSGVFWFLHELTAGDQIAIEWEGQTFSYMVERLCWVDRELDFTELVADAGAQTLTMITSAGHWTGGSHTHRLIVQASVAGGVAGTTCGPEVERDGFPSYGVISDAEGTGDVLEVQVIPGLIGEFASMFASHDGASDCFAELRRADGVPIFAAAVLPLRNSVLSLQWRLWERLEPGFYDMTVDCGARPATTRFPIADRPTRQF